MIQTLYDYSYIRFDKNESARITRIIGKNNAVDVYWNRENKNWIVCKKGSKNILKEFPTHKDINTTELREAFYRERIGGYRNLQSDVNLAGIAAQARKDKEKEEFGKEMRHHLNDAGTYEYEGKRSVTVLGG